MNSNNSTPNPNFKGFRLWNEAAEVGESPELLRALLQRISEDIEKFDRAASNKIECYLEDDQLYLRTYQGSHLFIRALDDKLELCVKKKDTQIFEYPLPKDGINIETHSWNFVTQVVPYIYSNWFMAEISPPFVDLSTKSPLTADQLKRVSDMFSVVSAEEYKYRGAINIHQMDSADEEHRQNKIAQKLGYSKHQILDLPKLQGPKVARVKGPGEGMLYYNRREMRRAMLKLKFQEKSAHEECGYQVFWGSGYEVGDLKFEQTHNICDVLTYQAHGLDQKKYWLTLNTIPSFPEGFEIIFQEKLQKFISELRHPAIDFEQDFDMPQLMRKFWDTNLDETFFTGGFIYHRDGVWGAYYDVAGYGQGNLLQGDPKELYFTYTFVPPGVAENESGFLHTFIDSNNASPQGSTWKPDWTDINWYFYPGQETEEILKCLRDYTHAY